MKTNAYNHLSLLLTLSIVFLFHCSFFLSQPVLCALARISVSFLASKTYASSTTGTSVFSSAMATVVLKRDLWWRTKGGEEGND